MYKSQIADDDDKTKLRELQLNYWLKRLEHTLAHTQNSSRLIYYVDGAVLAFIYFALQHFGPIRSIIFLAAFPTLLLAILNILHAYLIMIQRSWYSGIDSKLRMLLEVTEVKHDQKASTHIIYCAIHLVIACFLIIVSVGMFIYGCQCSIAEIYVK